MNWADFDALLDAALQEDAARHDVTTLALVPPDRRAQARLVARQPGVICGLPLARRLAQRLDARLQFAECVSDGDSVAAGAVAARMSGPAAAILSVERTLLNFVRHLSGVATLTRAYVEKIAGTDAGIYDTRKTTPGWRALEKYAVRCGGGRNHRMDLGDMVLIKDNHLELMGGRPRDPEAVREAVRRAREKWPQVPVEVEVEDLDQLEAALEAAPDFILLDNMTPEQTAQAVALVQELRAGGPRPQLESSGGIDISNVRDYAEAGVDRISIGALTHSAPALDLSLDIET
jgi:nicotinate-nucleotide pyrophosphorylase (carboxylating)